MNRKKFKEVFLQVIDENGETILQCDLFSVPLPESAVLQACLEFFSDPEPCMLHRSAAMSRLYMELLEYFLNALGEGINSYSFSKSLKSCEHLLTFISVKRLYSKYENRETTSVSVVAPLRKRMVDTIRQSDRLVC